MSSQIDHDSNKYSPVLVSSNVYSIRTFISNVVFVGGLGMEGKDWVLIDAGMPFSTSKIYQTAQLLFGKGIPPKAIILTHGHFDHVGSIKPLLDKWSVTVYAHEQELPYLTGKRDYLPPDPFVGGGLMALISPLYPRKAIDLGKKVMALPHDGSIPHMDGWRWIHTPGHTEGHIALFRETDRTLIAGDAFVTVKQESAIAVIKQKKTIHGPPAYFTTEWESAKQSIRKLKELHPQSAITGHGQVMSGRELFKSLSDLNNRFNRIAMPKQGRYVPTTR